MFKLHDICAQCLGIVDMNQFNALHCGRVDHCRYSNKRKGLRHMKPFRLYTCGPVPSWTTPIELKCNCGSKGHIALMQRNAMGKFDGTPELTQSQVYSPKFGKALIRAWLSTQGAWAPSVLPASGAAMGGAGTAAEAACHASADGAMALVGGAVAGWGGAKVALRPQRATQRVSRRRRRAAAGQPVAAAVAPPNWQDRGLASAAQLVDPLPWQERSGFPDPRPATAHRKPASLLNWHDRGGGALDNAAAGVKKRKTKRAVAKTVACLLPDWQNRG